MMMVTLGWLSLMLLGGAWWLRHDMATFRRFATLTDTVERQRVYWRWIVQSCAIFVGASAVSLALAGGLWPFDAFPAAFDPLHEALKSPEEASSADAGIGMAIGFSIGLAIVVAVQWWRLKKLLAPTRGPVDALVPRNRREKAIALLLSINAGFSEELFFRLALPLLLFQMSGSLVFAFTFAIICFGLAHAYQGWKGIAGTMAVGAALTMVYLAHGSLLRVIVIHALIDVAALLLRPAFSAWLARRFPGSQDAPQAGGAVA